MAVYNGERFLQEQLDSFVAQTRLPDELVVSDNASTDRTVEILREFASRAPFPVRIFINQSNLGVSKNFERAIRECTGDIIFLSDCDDVWYPDKISLMEQALAKSSRAGVVICDATLVDQDLRSLGCSLWQRWPFKYQARIANKMADGREFRRAIPANGNCMAFRARFKPLILPLFDHLPYDHMITWIISGSGAGGVLLVPKTLLAYRRHPQQVTAGTISRSSLLAARIKARRERPLRVLESLIERIVGALAGEYCMNQALRSAALRHWRARCSLPKNRIVRFPIVAQELISRRYNQFSGGLFTAVKDLVFLE